MLPEASKSSLSNLRPVSSLPAWVPDAVRLYLSHTAEGRSLRDLARAQGCHPSTVLRQVRRFENRRDDPLIDRALERLDTQLRPDTPSHRAAASRDGGDGATPARTDRASHAATTDPAGDGDGLETLLSSDAPRLLRRLAERGAMLAVAPEMEKAVILREGSDGRTHRMAVLDRRVAEAFALRDWISCRHSGRVSSYCITTTGRAALRRMSGLDDDTDPFEGAPPGRSVAAPVADDRARMRSAGAETPVAVLARRRNPDGTAFLGPDLVATAERLREDFELTQMRGEGRIDWKEWLATQGALPKRALSAPEDRMALALRDLGPGLADMVLRCCCYLEGLETAEKRMGWSARSGKIVLRIALERLKLHYSRLGEAHQMIG